MCFRILFGVVLKHVMAEWTRGKHRLARFKTKLLRRRGRREWSWVLGLRRHQTFVRKRIRVACVDGLHHRAPITPPSLLALHHHSRWWLIPTFSIFIHKRLTPYPAPPFFKNKLAWTSDEGRHGQCFGCVTPIEQVPNVIILIRSLTPVEFDSDVGIGDTLVRPISRNKYWLEHMYIRSTHKYHQSCT